ncbi:MAG: PPE family protein [Mycobacteriaceae bacterium]|nr:PPE family protein [Mycobacteriaceae bacterium]
MTVPIWMASPPELHSALLSSGPGPGSLLTAAGGWNALSAEYAALAQELSVVLADVQGGAWEGSSADAFVAAYGPYLVWLTQASQNSAEMAVQHEAAAVAYGGALTAMPTLPQLAANHAIHGALVATNFFGLNTIPIALNEIEYVQMWIQAAVTMALYQGQGDAALLVASLHSNPAVPPILKNALGGTADQAGEHDHDHEHAAGPLDDFIAKILALVTGGRVLWDPVEGTVNGIEYDAYVSPGQPIWWLVRGLEIFQDFEQFGVYLREDPVFAVQFLVELALFDWPTHILEAVSYLASNPGMFVGLAPLVSGLGSVSGFAGLAGMHPAAAVVPELVPVAAVPAVLPAVGIAPTISTATVVSASVTAPAPAAVISASAGVAPAPPPLAGGTGFGFPYLVGPPGIGHGSGMQTSAAARAQRKAPEPDAVAAAAVAAARERTRSRRRRRATRPGYGDEYVDMNVAVDPDWRSPSDPPPASSTVASDRVAGDLGFAGTIHKDEVVVVAGLTTMTGDDFGGGPTTPMLPGTWDPDGPSGSA